MRLQTRIAGAIDYLKEERGRRRFTTSYRQRYGFPWPPRWTDMTGYEPILDVILEHQLWEVEGDVLEIGVFLGGGTYKLCGLFAARAPDKTIYAVDVFDLSFDQTQTEDGMALAPFYQEAILRDAGTLEQRAVFDQVTGGCANLVTIAGDSTQVEIPPNKLCLSYIDGSHDPVFVRKDFATCWGRTAPGGIVAFHDYGGDLPRVTESIHQLIGEHAGEVARFWSDGLVALAKKR